jgi:Asp-tRNA(Asn)/Glu-tRNA(Gln) amidotransferase A subunit family amidase
VPFTVKRSTEAVPASSGIAFTGPACGEPRLIALAYAFEQATRHRVPPRLD